MLSTVLSINCNYDYIITKELDFISDNIMLELVERCLLFNNYNQREYHYQFSISLPKYLLSKLNFLFVEN